MQLLLNSKFGRRFLGMFLLLSLPIAAAGWFGMRRATNVLRAQTHNVLRVASDGAEAQLREFLNSLQRFTQGLAENTSIRSCLSPLQATPADLSSLLERLQTRIPEARELLALNLQGRVVAASSSELIGRDESASPEFQRGRETYFPGDVVLDPRLPGLRWRMSAPVKDPQTGSTLGVVVLGLDPGALSALTTGKRALAQGAGSQSFRIGETGETYIVNRQGYLLTESRYAPNSILKLRVDTMPVREAVEHGREIMADYMDYRGVTVSGASAIFPDRGWVLITEIDFNQAFAPIARLRKTLFWTAVAIALIAGLIARQFAKGIIKPLDVTAAADRALARGEEQSALVQEKGLPRDELGHFIRQRNARVRELLRRQRELIHEQKRRAEAAAELEAISYSMVHDMRAPLRAVIGFGDLLDDQAGAQLTPAQRDYLAHMKSACLRMDQLICDLLRYSSLLHTEVPLSPVNVPGLVRELMEDNPKLRAHKAGLELEGQIPSVIGNRAVLTQCFSVLLDNAFRYTRPGVPPRVRVCAEPRDDWIRILVEDNGTGMPKAFQQKVFGIFQRGTHSAEGTGIGLALVRVAVERMDGRVGVESEEGTGSRFWIELKPAALPQAPGAKGAQSLSPGS